MIILIYGKDSYRVNQAVKEEVENYKKLYQGSVSFETISAEEVSLKDFLDFVSAKSIFEKRKVLVIKNLFSKEELKSWFLKHFSKLQKSSDLFLLWETKQLSEKEELFTLLKKEAKVKEFDVLEGLALVRWVKEEVKKYNKEIDLGAILLLTQRTGSDLWRLSNEIKKLVSYCWQKKTITKKEVLTLVEDDLEADIFKGINYLAEGKKKEALVIFNNLVELGFSPAYIISMIAFQFRSLLIIKDALEKGKTLAQLLEELPFKPFFIKKSSQLCRSFSLEELKDIYSQIFRTEVNIKTGKVDPAIAIGLLVNKILARKLRVN